MKTLFYPLVFAVTAIISLSSCGTFTFTKRVHSSGYHVSYSKHHSSEKANDMVSEKNSVQKNANDNSSKNTSPTQFSNLAAIENRNLDTTTKNDLINPEDHTMSKKKMSPTTKIVSKVPIQIVKANPQSSFRSEVVNLEKTQIKKNQPAREDGLSLLWIVVIIVLILWLLGYLGGLGSFIHLLLLVALILLILWLLRII